MIGIAAGAFRSRVMVHGSDTVLYSGEFGLVFRRRGYRR